MECPLQQVFSLSEFPTIFLGLGFRVIQVFHALGTLGKALGCGLYWIQAHTWLHLMWALAPVKPPAALGLLYPTQNLCSVFTYTYGTVIYFQYF
jgi:hypothetical protein